MATPSDAMSLREISDNIQSILNIVRGLANGQADLQQKLNNTTATIKEIQQIQEDTNTTITEIQQEQLLQKAAVEAVQAAQQEIKNEQQNIKNEQQNIKNTVNSFFSQQQASDLRVRALDQNTLARVLNSHVQGNERGLYPLVNCSTAQRIPQMPNNQRELIALDEATIVPIMSDLGVPPYHYRNLSLREKKDTLKLVFGIPTSI